MENVVHRRALAGLWLYAVVIRAASLLGNSTLPTFTHLRLDAAAYHALATRVVHGDILLGHEPFHLSPLYSYFLALLQWVGGPSLWPIVIAQSLLGLATIELVRRMGTRLMGPVWGLIAAGILAAYAPMLHSETQISVASLATFLTAATLERLTAAFEIPATNMAALHAACVSLGFAVIARPNALLLVPVLLVWIFLREHKVRDRATAFRSVFVAGLLVAIPIAPVALRNQMVSGEKILVTDAGGLNFFLGNGLEANGSFRVPSEIPQATNASAQFELFRRYASTSVGYELNFSQSDSFWFARTRNEITADPLRWLRLLWTKTRLLAADQELPNSDSFRLAREVNPALCFAPMRWGLMVPFALIGAAVAMRRKHAGLLLVTGWLALMSLALVLFFVLSHYRVPLSVPLAILAAVGAQFVVSETLRIRKVGLFWIAGCAALTLILMRDVLPEPMSEEWRKLGYAYHVEGQLRQAEASYLRSLAEDGNNVSTRKNLATLYMSEGRFDIARREWTEVSRIATELGLVRYVHDAAAALAELDRVTRSRLDEDTR